VLAFRLRIRRKYAATQKLQMALVDGFFHDGAFRRLSGQPCA
jgi:hypothetical protein